MQCKAITPCHDKIIIIIMILLRYEYSRTKDRLWRKTRSSPRLGRCAGVDLNRNFGYKWGGKVIILIIFVIIESNIIVVKIYIIVGILIAIFTSSTVLVLISVRSGTIILNKKESSAT